MADKMTLEQTLSFFRSVIQSGEPWTETCESAYSASMAHIAVMGEPVAWQTLGENGQWFNLSMAEYWALKNSGVGQQRALYLAPPASGDWDKVREAIADLRRCQSREHALRIADRLAAALPESQPAQDTDVKDAARYRWLRDTPWLGTSLEPVITQQRNAHWDAAIDAAMAPESQP